MLDGRPAAAAAASAPTVPRDLETICLKCLQQGAGPPLPLGRRPGRRPAPLPRRRADPGPPGRPAGTGGGRWLSQRPALAATFLALAIFYASHLLFLALGKEDEGGHYHWAVTGLVGLGVGSATFQWLARQPAGAVAAVFGWAATDVLWFTLLLWLGEGRAARSWSAT